MKDAGGLYEAPLARVHAAGFGDIAAAAAGVLLPRLPPGATVVDLGCGPGALLRAVLDAGHAAVGVDVSAAMLTLARERAPEARLVHASALDAPLPPCDAVVAVGEVLSYAGAGPGGPGALAARARRALRPGGVLMLDVLHPGVAPGGPARAWRDGGEWLVAAEVEEDAAAMRAERRVAVFHREGAVWRRHDESHALVLHDPARVLADVRAAGFRARLVRGYGGLRFRRGHVGVIARAGGGARPRG